MAARFWTLRGREVGIVWKKILIPLVVLVFVLGMLPAGAQAATDYEFFRAMNWRAPQEDPVELGTLQVQVDPLMSGTHSALFALPSGFELDNLPATVASREDAAVQLEITQIGDNEFLGEVNVDNGNVKATFLLDVWSTIPRDATGDIVLSIEAGVGQLLDGAVVAGRVLPGEVTLQSSGVQTMVDGKSTVDISIRENAAGLLRDTRPIKLTLPVGFGWGDVSGELVSGKDLRLRPVTDGRVLELRVDRQSTERAEYRLTAEVLLTDAAQAVAGDVGATVSGMDRISPSSLLVARYTAPTPDPDPTPTPERAVFTIGSTAYTVDGERRQMDVAPYIRDGRTYLPLRFVGYSLGAGVHWIPEQKQAILTKGDTTVQFTVGSRQMLVNGEVRMLDVAPEIVAPGRTMLPYRFVVEAFGATADWDPAARTVTVRF